MARPSTTRRASQAVREAAARQGREVGILADLQGPKIRIEKFAAGKVVAARRATRFALVCRADAPPGDATQVGVSYLGLVDDVHVGRHAAARRRPDGAAGDARSKATASPPTCSPTAPCPTARASTGSAAGCRWARSPSRTSAHIVIAAQLGVDFLAVSFCRSAADMDEARALASAAGSDAALVAKIERAEAIENLVEITDRLATW